jgi:hypothetical protein
MNCLQLIEQQQVTRQVSRPTHLKQGACSTAIGTTDQLPYRTAASHHTGLKSKRVLPQAGLLATTRAGGREDELVHRVVAHLAKEVPAPVPDTKAAPASIIPLHGQQ